MSHRDAKRRRRVCHARAGHHRRQNHQPLSARLHDAADRTRPVGGARDRLTPDSTQANLRNPLFWESYTGIIGAQLRYPNSALIAISTDAEQFRSIPTRAYQLRGLRIKVPSNYDPAARSYTGLWDGR